MNEFAPALHDHLKAHQFKFVRVEGSGTRMFYKQWSSDESWLPECGMDLLQNGYPTDSAPNNVLPSFDSDNYKKLESTISKVNAYLEKSGAKQWWTDFLQGLKSLPSPEDAEHNVSRTG